MQFTGLTLSQVLMTLGAAGGVTLLLYLLRTRRRRVQVPFIPLWESLLRDRRSSRLFQSLRHLISLLLALLVVALLTFALGDPRDREDSPDVAHQVLLIDASVTMGATDVEPNRLQAAVDQARRLVAGAGARQRILIAQVDASVTPLSPMTDDPRLLDEALDAVALSDSGADHGRALEFAAAVLAGRSGASAVLLSDRAEPLPEGAAVALADAGVDLRFVPIGRRSENVAISAFAVRRYPLDKNRSELLVELHNGSDHAERVELTLRGDGQTIDVQTLELEAGARVRRVYDDVTGVRSELEAELRAAEAGHDDLPIDDRAHAVVPERKAMRVLCVTAGNRYLEAALLLDEYMQVDVVTPAEYAGAAGYDAVIFDAARPPEPPTVPALYIDPGAVADGHTPLETRASLERPFFDRLRRKHPLLRFTAMADVNIASADALVTVPGDVVVAADRRGALVVAGEREGLRFVALGFDLRDTDLPLRVAWPLLLLNTIEWFTVDEQEQRSSLDVGESTTIELPAGVEQVTHMAPDASERTLPVRDGRVTLTPERVGFHELRWPGGRRALAAALDGSTLRPLAPAEAMVVAGRAVPPPTVPEPAPARPPWAWLALVAFALLAIEWLTFHRRWTV